MNVLRIRNEMRSGKTIFDLPLRVTFYARVSTDKDEQINSLENQVQYYTEWIQAELDICAGVYRRGHQRHEHEKAGQLLADDTGRQSRAV